MVGVTSEADSARKRAAVSWTSLSRPSYWADKIAPAALNLLSFGALKRSVAALFG